MNEEGAAIMDTARETGDHGHQARSRGAPDASSRSAALCARRRRPPRAGPGAALGGLLLIPPSQSQHAMIYLGILVDDKLRGQPASAVAAEVAKSVGVETFDKEEPARMTDPQGAILRGTAFYGKISEKIPEQRGLARRAKIVIFPLEPNTWAQAWTVTQPGMNPVEYKAVDRVLNNITLTSE